VPLELLGISLSRLEVLSVGLLTGSSKVLAAGFP